MERFDAHIDRIHYLVERSNELVKVGMEEEARLLMMQAIEISSEIRGNTAPLAEAVYS